MNLQASGPLGPRIIVALDYGNAESALALAARLPSDACRLKVGKELFTAAGPELVRRLSAMGFEIFLDLKFHDIPNTVAAACRAAVDLGVWMLNVHASGGRAMLEAARAAVPADGGTRLIAVTVLTSLQSEDLQAIGIEHSAESMVSRLAALTHDAGLDGVVCSAREAAALKQSFGPEFLLVTPGIRPAGSTGDDQRRVLTPAQAIAAGSDYLVVGRPITQADNPCQILLTMNEEISH